MSTEIKSPCVNICRLIPDNKFGLICSGCLRTPDEIRNWAYKSDEDKLEILKRLELRKSVQINYSWW